MTDKQKRGTVIEARAREMVLSVTKYFEDERNSCKDLLQAFSKLVQNEETDSQCEVKVPVKLLTDVIQLLRATTRVTERVVAATNINKNTLTKIRREGEAAKSNNSSIKTPVKRPRGKKKFFERSDLENFKTIIHTNFIKKNEIFKLSTILLIARNEFNYQGSKATLRRIVSGLGFQLIRSQGKPVLTVCDKLDKYSEGTKTGKAEYSTKAYIDDEDDSQTLSQSMKRCEENDNSLSMESEFMEEEYLLEEYLDETE